MKNILSAALSIALLATAARTVAAQSSAGLVAVNASGSTGNATSAADAKAKSRFETAQSAMVAAGRLHPSDAETLRAAAAMERGVSKAQIQAIAHSADADRSLVVAFEVLSSLRARGMTAVSATATVQANITSGASDQALSELVSVSSRKP